MRELSIRGGSLSITIPIEVVRLLELKSNDLLVFFYDRKNKRIILDKVKQPFITAAGGFTFSISKEKVRKLLKELKEGER